MRGSSAPGDITSFTLSHVRSSVAGSCARYFQKLFTSGTLRVFLMSSKTARTCADASAYSIGGGWLTTFLLRVCETPSPLGEKVADGRMRGSPSRGQSPRGE